VELVGVADPVAGKAEAVTGEVGGRPFHDYAALLEADIDILSVCLPTALHLPAAEAAAQSGTHLMMEKPIARSVQEADRMLAVCGEAGLRLMVGFTHRFYPEMREAKRLVDGGVIGKPLTVHDSMSITHRFIAPWYRDREAAGGGVFMCNAVHGFDRASWVLGQTITALTAAIEPTEGSLGEDYGSDWPGLTAGRRAPSSNIGDPTAPSKVSCRFLARKACSTFAPGSRLRFWWVTNGPYIIATILTTATQTGSWWVWWLS
jgi:predicted dehydrogenase